MLEDRHYMRQPRFRAGVSATAMLLVALVIAFALECFAYGYPPQFTPESVLPLSWDGLKHGYIWQLLSFQFLHAGFLHLICNGLVIFFLGRELEETLGRSRFLTLYFSSGVAGGLLHALAGGVTEHIVPTSLWTARFIDQFGGPVVGASAGAAGLLAGFAILYPERQLTVFLYFIPVNIRAKFLLLFSALLSLAGIAFPGMFGKLVANDAHLGGIIAGICFIRYAGSWHWPQLHRRAPSPRRLIRVPSQKTSAWGLPRRSEDDDLPPDEFLSKEVDPILDKISAHGIQSLTERERRILEAAREKMAKR
jgi:membrane associated rhomboid family serine protease